MTKPVKREAILTAARAEFSSLGYHGARIERIAAAASANKQLIFHYFGSKDGLYAAAVSNIFSTFPESFPTAGQPPETLRRRADAIAEWLVETDGAATSLVECLSGRGVPAAASESARSWVGAASAQLRAALDEGQMRGYFRDDIDADAVVELIIGSAVGAAMMATGRRLANGRAAVEPSLIGRLVADYCGWR